jgi:hypothetical protein
MHQKVYGRAQRAANAFGANHIADHVRARLALHGRALGAAHGRARLVVAVPGLVIPGRLVSARGYAHAGQSNAYACERKTTSGKQPRKKTPVVHRMTHMILQGLAATESFL